MFYILLSNATVATGPMWLLGTWDVASVTEELNFKFHLILFHVNLNSHMWLVAMVLYKCTLE